MRLFNVSGYLTVRSVKARGLEPLHSWPQTRWATITLRSDECVTGGDRTPNPTIKNRLLYRLSYRDKCSDAGSQLTWSLTTGGEESYSPDDVSPTPS